MFGASGMLMLRALAEGSADAATMADVASGGYGARSTSSPWRWTGTFEHQRLPLGLHIRRLAEINRDLAAIETAINDAMRPFAIQRACLATIPGVNGLLAATIVAEISIDMAAFGTAQRLVAWATLLQGWLGDVWVMAGVAGFGADQHRTALESQSSSGSHTCAGLHLTFPARLHQGQPPLHLLWVGRPGSILALALARLDLRRRGPSPSNPDARRSPCIRRSFQLNLCALQLRTQPHHRSLAFLDRLTGRPCRLLRSRQGRLQGADLHLGSGQGLLGALPAGALLSQLPLQLGGAADRGWHALDRHVTLARELVPGPRGGMASASGTARPAADRWHAPGAELLQGVAHPDLIGVGFGIVEAVAQR